MKKRRTRTSCAARNHPPPLLVLIIVASCIVVPTSPFAPIIGIHASTSQTASGSGASSPAPDGVGTRAQQRRDGSCDGSSMRSRTASGVKASTPALNLLPRNRDPVQRTCTDATTSSTATPSSPSQPKLNERNWKDGEYNTTIPSKLLYTYAGKLLDIASERRLESDDAFHVPDDRLMARAVTRLEDKYGKCRDKAKRRLQQIQAEEEDYHNGEGAGTQKHSTGLRKWPLQRRRDRIATSESLVLANALLQSQKEALILTGMLRLLNTSVQAFPALLVARLLRQIESGSLAPSQPLLTALSLVCVLTAKMIIENQFFHGVLKYACEVRGALAGMIFDKSLRLSSGGSKREPDDDDARSESDENKNKNKSKKRREKTASAQGSGGVLNLMQSDTATMESLAMQLHTMWDGLLQISIYTALLYRYLGPPVIWGIGVLLTTIPINSLTLRMLRRLTREEYEAKDARTKRTTECISSMKLLKLQSWEDFFARDVQEHREEELKRHTKRGVVRALNQAISNAVPAITLVVTLSAYARAGRPMVASTIFTAITLFQQLRFPLFFYPMLLDSMANGLNALRRISSFLAQEEITPYVEYRPKIDGKGGSIELTNGNFLWTASSEPGGKGKTGLPALCDATVSIAPGEVVAVVGDVGSGKTCLVKSLIGELAPVPRMAVNQTSRGKGMSYESDVPRVVSHGSIAYCAQEAWLPKGTIRESIVFGREYDEERYLKAICDAGLDADISASGSTGMAAAAGVLTHETDVGEDGSNLSGGQRARVALARALYEDSAGVYVLDDPLSALDASVGSTVFERLTSRLRKDNAATVFVTNDPSVPSRCDKVILMGSSSSSSESPPCSRIIDTGTYEELIARGHDLRTIVHPEVEEDATSEEDEADMGDFDAVTLGDIDGAACQIESQPQSQNSTIQTDCHADPDCKLLLKQDPGYLAEHVVPQLIEPTDYTSNTLNGKANGKKDTSTVSSGTSLLPSVPQRQDVGVSVVQQKQLSADDSMPTGAIPRSTYFTYIKAVRNPLLIAAALGSFIASNGAQFVQQYIIAKWTEMATEEITAAVSARYLQNLVYAAGMVSVFLWLRSYLMMRVGVRASKYLHRGMLSSVFNAPLSFFSATPSGQLLTRFGRELDVVDRSLPDGIASVLFCVLQIFFSTLALAGVVTPLMVIPLGLVGILYIKIMGRFRPAARDLKRCESKSRAPIYTHFKEALRGVETIRTVPRGRSLWAGKHRALTDENLSVYYSVKALDRWLSVRLETCGNVVVFAAAVASVFLTRAGRLKSGSAGWGLTQALSITGLLAWAVRVLTDLENQFLSVVRVTEVTDLESTKVKGLRHSAEGKSRMPKEYSEVGEALGALRGDSSTNIVVAPLAPPSDSALLKSGWPWKGEIEFKNISMRYSPSSPLVLKNITTTVPAGTTLGIVGRTASGKSSLLLTLFRLVEIEGGGLISIDGVDTRSLSLRGLRDSLSIIPQSPTLFAGTLMYNLDATGRASADEAWNALEAASPDLARQFRDAGTGLDTIISEGGENLSLGQRQLICLARALLKKSKVLVLDEATSSVDTKTDAEVQETIRREFVEKGVTVITVAHRLDTVLGNDRIAVLDKGALVEYGAPNDLLRMPKGTGYLRKLVDADRKNRQKGARKKQKQLASALIA